MMITSPAFAEGNMMDDKYTCKGKDINPPLKISGIPEGAKSLALIVDDPDAPAGTWTHWVVYNIQPTEEIKEDSVPGKQGENNFGKISYNGPCPPSGVHRYFFRLYALDDELGLKEPPARLELEAAMEEHIIARAEVYGLYGKKD